MSLKPYLDLNDFFFKCILLYFNDSYDNINIHLSADVNKS